MGYPFFCLLRRAFLAASPSKAVPISTNVVGSGIGHSGDFTWSSAPDWSESSVGHAIPPASSL